MSEQKERIFVPGSSAKAKDLEFGTVVNLSFDVAELQSFAKTHKKESKNGKNYLNLSIVPRKKVGDYGDTHSVQLDTWEPKPQGEPTQQKVAKPKKVEQTAPVEEDDVPF